MVRLFRPKIPLLKQTRSGFQHTYINICEYVCVYECVEVFDVKILHLQYGYCCREGGGAGQ